MSIVRIGIIGFGSMASAHAKYIMDGEVKGAKLTAVYDIDPKRLETAKKEYGENIKIFEDVNNFFDSKAFDAVLVATPHFFHPEYAITALNKGYHVLIEKPAGVYTKQVQEMNQAAKNSDKTFGIMFNQRTNPVYAKAKDLIDSGELGKIKRSVWIITNWYRTQSYYDSGDWRATWKGEGGGVLLNQDPHQLDLWQWICGMPNRLRAFCYFGKYHDIEVEDDVTAYAEYENGATGIFITSTGESPGTNRFEISGDRGKLVIENDTLKFSRLRVSERKFNKEFKAGFGQPECWEVDVPIGDDNPQHKGITQNFVNAILKGDKLLAPGEEGINSLSLSNAMLLSQWTNDWVSIPFNDEKYYNLLKEKIANSKYEKKVSNVNLNTKGTY